MVEEMGCGVLPLVVRHLGKEEVACKLVSPPFFLL